MRKQQIFRLDASKLVLLAIFVHSLLRHDLEPSARTLPLLAHRPIDL